MSCRVHPGETPASHALRGFLDFIVSDDEEAASLRRAAAFVVVPMLNPDGCALGNYRTDSLGQDLNRAWTAPTRATEPTLEATKRLARRFAEDPAFELVAYVDCHAHTSSRRSFLFCNPPEDASDFEAWERAAALPRLIDARGGGDFGFSLAQCKFCAAPDKAGAGRRAVGEMLADVSPGRLGTVACYTLEMSFYSVPIAQKSWSSSMSDEACYEGFGGVLGRAFVDLFECGDNPKAAAVMRRVARAAEVKRALDDARRSETEAEGDGDGEGADLGGSKSPGRAVAGAAAAAFHVTGDAMFGFGCGAFASEHRLGTVDRAKRAASARPSRANVGGVSPPRWNTVASGRRVGVGVGGVLRVHRRGSLRGGGEGGGVVGQTRPRRRRRNPRSPRFAARSPLAPPVHRRRTRPRGFVGVEVGVEPVDLVSPNESESSGRRPRRRERPRRRAGRRGRRERHTPRSRRFGVDARASGIGIAEDGRTSPVERRRGRGGGARRVPGVAGRRFLGFADPGEIGGGAARARLRDDAVGERGDARGSSTGRREGEGEGDGEGDGEGEGRDGRGVAIEIVVVASG